MCVPWRHGVHVEIKGRLAELGSFLPLREFWGQLRSSDLAASTSTFKPSHCPVAGTGDMETTPNSAKSEFLCLLYHSGASREP